MQDYVSKNGRKKNDQQSVAVFSLAAYKVIPLNSFKYNKIAPKVDVAVSNKCYSRAESDQQSVAVFRLLHTR